jgi:hypothetical protein
MGSPLDPEYPPLLPAGLVDISDADLEARFVTPFPGSLTRRDLLGRFRALAAYLRRLGLTGEMWLDGSFLTDKINPDDIDLVLLIENSVLQTISIAAFDIFSRMVNNKAVTVARYRCDLYFCDPSDAPLLAYWRDWFGLARDRTTPKGIARVVL